MIPYIKKITPFAFIAILASSCADTDSKTVSVEETEITTMDSTAKAAKETSDKLEEQTKKVEASLEKLDSEFKTTK